MSDRWPPERRFWLRVEKRGPDECWNWEGGLTVKGYGVIFKTGGKRTTVHRFSWELHNASEIPPGQHVLHNCDNRRCVNPAHLRLGTNAENVQDRVARNRTRTGRRKQCKNGHTYTPETLLVRKSGLRLCRICKNNASRRHYEKHKDRIYQRTLAWRRKNREKLNALGRVYAERAKLKLRGML